MQFIQLFLLFLYRINLFEIMKPTNSEIAEAFSKGNFEFSYSFLTDDIKWNIVGDKILNGKEEVIEFCNQTSDYFKTVKTIFKTDNIIIDSERIAVNGSAQFINKENKTTEVSSCDIYIFENEKLKEITSYCIMTNNEK